MRVRIPRIDGADGSFTLAAAGALGAQSSRPAARYLEILQHRTHAIPGLQKHRHGKITLRWMDTLSAHGYSLYWWSTRQVRSARLVGDDRRDSEIYGILEVVLGWR